MKPKDKPKKQSTLSIKPTAGFGGKFGVGKPMRFNVRPFNPGSFKTQHKG